MLKLKKWANSNLYISIFRLTLRCLLVARKENLTDVSTSLTGRSKNLDPTGYPAGAGWPDRFPSLIQLFHNLFRSYYHLHVIVPRQHSFFRKTVAVAASRWQHWVQRDQPEIWTSHLSVPETNMLQLINQSLKWVKPNSSWMMTLLPTPSSKTSRI